MREGTITMVKIMFAILKAQLTEIKLFMISFTQRWGIPFRKSSLKLLKYDLIKEQDVQDVCLTYLYQH